VLAHGRERTVDVAEVDGRTFLGIASYGFDSDVQDIANTTTVVKGPAVYLYATLRALRSWRPVRFTYAADGGPEGAFAGYSLAASNSGRFGGGMQYVPDADLEDGLLDVVVARDTPKLTYLLHIPKVFRGTHIEGNEHIEVLRAREVRVDSERPFRIYADGDPIGTTPATIRAVPGALRVLVP
jgi:diacylglycerol kinase family enzyme